MLLSCAIVRFHNQLSGPLIWQDQGLQKWIILFCYIKGWDSAVVLIFVVETLPS